MSSFLVGLGNKEKKKGQQKYRYSTVEEPLPPSSPELMEEGALPGKNAPATSAPAYITVSPVSQQPPQRVYQDPNAIQPQPNISPPAQIQPQPVTAEPANFQQQSGITEPNGGVDFMNGDDQYEVEEITLERGETGLGLHIAGGTDNPQIEDDPAIYILEIIDGGVAAADGRLRTNDIIVSVNDYSMVNILHSQAVDALKRAGNTVVLMVKRLKNQMENMMEIELTEGNKGLGIGIAGGISNQHIPGHNGIFVTKVMNGGAARLDGPVGDTLLTVNEVNIDNVTHEDVVAALRATQERGLLVADKPTFLDPNTGSPLHSPGWRDNSPAVVEIPYGILGHHGAPTVNQQQFIHQVHQAPPSHKSIYSTLRKTSHGQQSEHPRAMDNNEVPRTIADSVIPRNPRKVIMNKGQIGLGFNIVGGRNGEGIFIPLILAGGPADLNGTLHRGDQLLSVNSIDVMHCPYEQVVDELRRAGETVEIIAQYKPEEYNRFIEAKIDDSTEQMMKCHDLSGSDDAQREGELLNESPTNSAEDMEDLKVLKETLQGWLI